MCLNYNCTVGWFEFIVGKFVNDNCEVRFMFILVGFFVNYHSRKAYSCS